MQKDPISRKNYQGLLGVAQQVWTLDIHLQLIDSESIPASASSKTSFSVKECQVLLQKDRVGALNRHLQLSEK
jgi:hypothetical protein